MNQVLTGLDEFWSQTAISTQKMIDGANVVVESIYGFLTKIATVTLLTKDCIFLTDAF